MGWLSTALVFLSFLSAPTFAQESFSIEDYDSRLPSWGATWRADKGAVNGYYPSFYTGFALRSEFPDRIHVRLSRGNQTRVSVILDDVSLMDYLYDLKKRYDFYQSVLVGPGRRSMVTPSPQSTPQVDYFFQILESTRYDIKSFTSQSHEEKEIYRKSLAILKELNPGRVFDLDIDLKVEFQNWKKNVRKGEYNIQKETDVILALNSLVWGRVNYTEKPNSEVLESLRRTFALAQSDDEEAFVASAVALFKQISKDKYQFRVLNQNDQWESPIQCNSAQNCHLRYSEFTAIYPTGSHKSFVSDGRGNQVPSFATPGLWNFLERSYHDVDNIRKEPYYGWAPKMDYEAAGNGFHNPAVRFWGISDGVRKALGVDPSHTTLWSVKRGGVSHGCSRLPLGHVWEMRHILPVESHKMTEVFYFGHRPQDFDLYDVNGDGDLEVMGVEYLISYGLKGSDGLARREGSDLQIGSEGKLHFYENLYGRRSVFSSEVKKTETGESIQFRFIDPNISYPSYLDYQKSRVSVRQTLKGEYPLYEQAYARDKVQFYIPYTTDGLTSRSQDVLSKRIVRLMGRVRGCAPFADKKACGEEAFDKEAASLMKAMN